MASVAGVQGEARVRRQQGRLKARITAMSPAAIITLLVVASGIIRLALAFITNGHGFDHWTMQVWTRALVDHPLHDFYGLDLDVPQDHLPGDLLIFAGLGRLISTFDPGSADRNIPDAVTLKGVAIVADLLIGMIVYRTGMMLAGKRAALIAFVAWVFHPAIIFNSSIWGQWDAVSALPLMFAVLLVLRGGRSIVWCWVALAYACLIKPQLALVAPFLLIYAWRRGGSQAMVQSGLGIGLGLAFVQLIGSLFRVGLPGVPTRWSLTDRMWASVEEYDAVSMGAGNIWLLPIGRGWPFSDQDIIAFGLTAQVIGVILLAVGLCVAMWVAWRTDSPEIGLVAASAIAFMVMFMVMTRMHERYLFPAIPLAILAALALPTLRKPLALLTVTFTVNLFLAYTNGNDSHLIPALQTDAFYRLNTVIQLTAGLWLIWRTVVNTRAHAAVCNPPRRTNSLGPHPAPAFHPHDTSNGYIEQA